MQSLLDTKMTGKSKTDFKGKLEQCMGYIKQLRACVRYLDTESQMLEADRCVLRDLLHCSGDLFCDGNWNGVALISRYIPARLRYHDTPEFAHRRRPENRIRHQQRVAHPVLRPGTLWKHPWGSCSRSAKASWRPRQPQQRRPRRS